MTHISVEKYVMTYEGIKRYQNDSSVMSHNTLTLSAVRGSQKYFYYPNVRDCTQGIENNSIIHINHYALLK